MGSNRHACGEPGGGHDRVDPARAAPWASARPASARRARRQRRQHVLPESRLNGRFASSASYRLMCGASSICGRAPRSALRLSSSRGRTPRPSARARSYSDCESTKNAQKNRGARTVSWQVWRPAERRLRREHKVEHRIYAPQRVVARRSVASARAAAEMEPLCQVRLVAGPARRAACPPREKPWVKAAIC